MRLVKATPDPPQGLLEVYRELGGSENGFFGENDVAARKLPIIHDQLQRLVDRATGRNLPAGWVPVTTFWLLDDSGVVAGVSRFRHHLNAELLHHGGHIGYYIRPAYRGKGHGKTILALTLQERATSASIASCSRWAPATNRRSASSKPAAASWRTSASRPRPASCIAAIGSRSGDNRTDANRRPDPLP